MKNKSLKKKDVFLLLSCILLSNCLIWRNCSTTTPLIDFTYQIENAYRILKGQVPYRDFFLVLTPGTYYVFALFLYLFNGSNLAQILLVMVVQDICLIFAYSIVRRVCPYKLITCILIFVCAVTEQVMYPYVSYNYFCLAAILIAFWYFIKYVYQSDSPQHFLREGILVTIPFLFKQNYGLFFAMGMYSYILYMVVKRKKVKFLLYSLIGTLASASFFVIYLLINQISLYSFLYQTFWFPAENKNILGKFKYEVLGLFNKANIILIALTVVLIIVLSKIKLKEKWEKILLILISGFIWGICPFFPNTDFDLNIWYFAYLYLGYTWITKCFIRDNIWSDLSAKIVAFLIFMFGYLTHAVVSEVCILIILIAFILNFLYHLKTNKSIIFMMISICMLGWYSLQAICFFETRWVNEEGELVQVIDSRERMYKIGIKGPWLGNLQDLTLYIQSVIGDESFVEVPCEDPIYWSTNTVPQLDFFQLHHETCPYTKDEIIEKICENQIEYIIVKRVHQCEFYLFTEEEIPELIETLESKGYNVINELGMYTILKRQDDNEI